MERDRIKWNEKFRNGHYPHDVSDVVRRFCHLAAGKKALDIAAGNGRHAVFLSQKGFSVDAVDISDVGLAGFSGKHSNIHTVCADLDQFDIPPDRYDLILNIKYLNRRLFPQIQEGLKSNGVLIFHTLLESDRTRTPHGHCRDYLLRPNELMHAFLGLRIVYYAERLEPGSKPPVETATLVARKT